MLLRLVHYYYFWMATSRITAQSSYAELLRRCDSVYTPTKHNVFEPTSGQGPFFTFEMLLERSGRAVTRYDFSALFAEAWSKAMTLKNIMSGFETTGIYPFNPKTLLPEETFTEFHPEELSKSTGTKFIPLYSPSTYRHCFCFSIRQTFLYK